MNAKPSQLTVLGNLLRSDEVGVESHIIMSDSLRHVIYAPPLALLMKRQEKNREVVVHAVTSIATEDRYYRVLNNFLRDKVDLLDMSFAFLLRQKG